jgi:hypothetical protein
MRWQLAQSTASPPILADATKRAGGDSALLHIPCFPLISSS